MICIPTAAAIPLGILVIIGAAALIFLIVTFRPDDFGRDAG